MARKIKKEEKALAVAQATPTAQVPEEEPKEPVAPMAPKPVKQGSGLVVTLVIIIAVLLAILAGILGFMFGAGGIKLFATPTPTPTQTPTPTSTATVTPTPDKILKNTYTNEKYKYQFNYPDGATITEATEKDISLSPEEVAAGKTFAGVFAELTGKVCISLSYLNGYITITPKENAAFEHVLCGRTGRAYDGPDKSESLTIMDKVYTAKGFEEQGPGETLNFHNETLVVKLDDGTRIEYGAGQSETATWSDYLLQKPDLLKIVQSYKSL